MGDRPFAALEKGGVLLKFCRNGAVHDRTFRVELSHRELLWTSKNKPAYKTVVDIDTITEIREGLTTPVLEREAARRNIAQNRCFSILYGEGGQKALNLAAASSDAKTAWVKGLTQLWKDSAQVDTTQVFLRKAWRESDRNRDDKLSLSEIRRLLHRLNFDVANAHQVEINFNEVDILKTGVLTYSQFDTFYRRLKYRAEVAKIFKQFAKNHPAMLNLEEFREFLKVEQHQDVSAAEAQKLIDRFRKGDVSDKNVLSWEGFSAYFNSELTNAFELSHLKVYQDMSHPLAHYYINSSHNTYLMGDQLRGKSSTEAYARALLLGCRCVELDCWDGPNGQPIIFHGHTLTSKITFQDVITAIKVNAFKTSPYPIILSLEVHCSVPQQQRMAHILAETLGPMLYTTPAKEGSNALPSPNDLKNKILVKGKTLESHGGSVGPDASNTLQRSMSVNDEDSDEEDDVVKDTTTGGTAPLPKPKKVKIHKDLSDLVQYCMAVKFKSFDHSEKSARAEHMSSFGERKSEKLASTALQDYIRYNTRQLSRIYPGGARVDSSNLDPRVHWNAGCQVVALNFQTHDRPMQLNLGRFQQNGSCGYVLKPTALLNPDAPIDVRPRNVSIRVIDGQQLPKPNQKSKGEVIDPYVIVDVVGVDEDTTQFKTKTIKDNGFNPIWDESFNFKLTRPDLALIRFCVMDYDVGDADDFIASNTIPVQSMLPGYRIVSLFDSKWTKLTFANLCVHVTFSDVSE